jgi:hypothetical protein
MEILDIAVGKMNNYLPGIVNVESSIDEKTWKPKLLINFNNKNYNVSVNFSEIEDMHINNRVEDFLFLVLGDDLKKYYEKLIRKEKLNKLNEN